MQTVNETAQVAIFLPDAKEKFTVSHRKEGKVQFEQYAALVPSKYNNKKAFAAVDLRIYYTSTTAYACIWIMDGEGFGTHGSGSAGGYGYDKASSAAAEAIKNARFKLSVDIGGVGNSAIEEAVLAIAVTIGHPKAMIHHAHQ